MLNLPTQLEAQFREICSVEPSAVARALSDLDGKAGATWVATDTTRLVFFCRSSSSGDFDMKPYRYADASSFEVEDDGKFAFMRITFPDRKVELKFSSMEQMTIGKLENYWTPVTEDKSVQAPAQLTPMLIFLASLQALIQADRDLASQELGWIQENMIDTNALRRAGAWLRENDLGQLVVRINEDLNVEQKTCLHANLISLAMADGAYRAKEAEVIEQIRDAIGLPQDKHDLIFDLLLARSDIKVFFNAEGEPVSPESLNLCAACLLAMARHDGQPHEREERMVRKIIGRSDAINSALTYVQQLGLKGVLGFLPGTLDEKQRRFILLNLMMIGTADGVFDRSKQTLMDRFRRRLQVSEEVYQKDFDLYLTFQNLSVFAAETPKPKE
ncbi:MAG: TerB family tellurite resistance protein [Limisphaerales bacterium]